MIGFTFTDKLLEKATIIAKRQKKLKNSIRNGKGTPVGNIGEVITKAVLGGHIIEEIPEAFDYDILTDDGVKIEVKTKEIGRKNGRDITPNLEWEGSVTKANDKQKCDYYAFCRVNMNHKKGWYMGKIPRREFFDKARFLKKGMIDPRNEYTVAKTCWNIEYGDLND